MFQEKESRAAQPQSGNAAWKASRQLHGFTRGLTNRRLCCEIVKATGKPCGQIAMRNVPCCFFHGGKGQQVVLKYEQAKHSAKAKAANAISRASARRFKQQGITVPEK
jgi:hypothetical protein